MVTPVGIAYTFRMLADMTVGPFAPLWQTFGSGNFEWATNQWSARFIIMLGESWQWIPFIFIVMLAAFESQPRDEVDSTAWRKRRQHMDRAVGVLRETRR